MQTHKSTRRSLKLLFCVTLATLIVHPFVHAQGRKRNPTSKIYVADVTGDAQIDTGETINELIKRSVYTAQGTVIETKENSSNAMVWSNGTGLYLDPNTRMEVKRFVQEPFTPNRKDMEVEPSISNTDTIVTRGTVALCTSKLVAGSKMKYHTPHASVNVKGGKIVIHTDAQGSKISLLEGDITVRAGELDTGGQTLKQGQQAIISPSGNITIQDIPSDERAALDEMATVACMARKTVYFEAKDKQDPAFGSDDVTAFDGTGGDNEGTDDITVVEVTPTDTDPIITVSPASVRKTTTP